LGRPISVILLICIALAIYYSLKPQPWENEDEKEIKEETEAE
jgi:hypothetical protein